MSIGIDRLKDLMKDDNDRKITCITSEKKTLKDKIKALDEELDSFDSSRIKINSLKVKKDKFIIQYINETNFPKPLDLRMLNYKALLFYFIDHFTYENTILKYEDFEENDELKIYSSKKDIFKNLFFVKNFIYKCDDKNTLLKDVSLIPKAIKINVNTINFPHLIGYKDHEKTTKDDFIRNIMYESNLSNDYENDGCDKSKIQAFSWILDTLKNPHWVFDSEGIRTENSKLKSDIIFVRKHNATYHYVSLEKHLENIDNEYYINSHHHMRESNFKKTFNDNKKIYTKKR